MLREFCVEHDIPEFKIALNLNDRTYDAYTGNKIYFSSEILGGDAFEKSELLSVARKMATQIDDSIGEIIPESKKQKAFIYTRWNKLRKANFEDYFKQGRKKYYLSNREIRNKTIAVLVDESFGVGKIDLIFTTEGIILDKAFTGFNENPDIIQYKKINSDNNKLDINGELYKNKEINMFALFDLIQELAELSASINPENSPAGYLSHNDTYLIESYDD